MKMNKKVLLALGCAAFAFSAFAQTSTSSKSESNVEDEYLSEVDGVVILGLAASEDYENKLVAMQMIEAAVDGGNTNPDVMKALNQLAGEGINTQARNNGRLVNNFPDIRRRACLTLGKVKTEESKNYLLAVTLAENEPSVIAAAVNSLGEVGINNHDEVVNAISFANRRNEILNPTSSLAAEVVDAYEKLADTTENKKEMTDSLTRIAADYHYNSKVRGKALSLLKKMSDTSSSSSSK